MEKLCYTADIWGEGKVQGEGQISSLPLPHKKQQHASIYNGIKMQSADLIFEKRKSMTRTRIMY